MLAFEKFYIAIEAILIAVIGFIFIATAAFCVVELSSRISAKSIVLAKVDSIEKASTDTSTPDAAADVSSRLNELRALRIILDDLDHLAVSGAEKPRQTIHAIRQRLNEQSIEESVRLEAQQKIERVNELDTELERLRSEGLQLASDLDRARSQFELEVETGQVSGTTPGIGATAEQLRNAINQLEERRIVNDERIARVLVTIEDINSEISVANQNVLNWSPSEFLSKNYIFYMQSDLILAISVILCGGIGAIFTASRSRRPKFAKSIFNGLMAGFVAFLVIKGGRSFFLVDLNFSSGPTINPYAAAFSGILAGLFTEKAYRILSDATDRIGERIVRAEEGK